MRYVLQPDKVLYFCAADQEVGAGWRGFNDLDLPLGNQFASVKQPRLFAFDAVDIEGQHTMKVLAAVQVKATSPRAPNMARADSTSPSVHPDCWLTLNGSICDCHCRDSETDSIELCQAPVAIRDSI